MDPMAGWVTYVKDVEPGRELVVHEWKSKVQFGTAERECGEQSASALTRRSVLGDS